MARILFRVFQALTGVLLGLVVVYFLLRPESPGTWDGQDDYFLPDPIPAPVFELTSQDGERVGSEDFPGRILAVFFGFTACPDVCPLTLSHLSRAFQEMGEDGEGVQVLLITVDPERDTPERLAQYLELFHPSFLGLTGTEEEIREVADAFGAFFVKVGEGDQYTVDHTARTYIIDTQGRIPLTFPITATPDEMARDLTRLLEGRP
jgi:protein SCO1